MKCCLYICFSVVIVFISCKNDDGFLEGSITDSRDGKQYQWSEFNGTIWLTEDLQLNGKTTYTFYEALSACPEGWQLASNEDWKVLAENNGGYYFYDTALGNPEEGFENLVDPTGFHATSDANYWTSTPAWEESFTIRSSFIGFFSSDYGGIGNPPAVVMGPNLKSFSMRCRCVQKEPTNTGTFEFQSSDTTYNFGDYFNYSETNGTLTIHAYNLTGTKDEEWAQLTINLDDFLADDIPDASGELRYVVTEELTEFSNDTKTYITEELELSITNYSTSHIEGTFSGILTNSDTNSSEIIPISQGTFSIALGN
ncbi:hypothetical protein [Flagellimonas iocasae]|uniref:Fibrobacter succinogenes major paralogous domain-containing protein n=1 Tax=Flagellimonas iocasae TaxID=2055905 RepID=A0ABW4XRQ1_9FLAO